MTEYEAGQMILELMADDDGLRVIRDELARLYRRRLAAATAVGGPGRNWRDAYVTADDARRIMSRLGIRFNNNNKLGALWKRGEWEWTGQRIKSETKGSHGNELKCWRLK
jgi:hypothetical protein